MRRRDYMLLIEAMRQARPLDIDATVSNLRRGQWTDDVQAIAEALARDNRAFDPQRFIKDCQCSP